jgi:hypothetical protein
LQASQGLFFEDDKRKVGVSLATVSITLSMQIRLTASIYFCWIKLRQIQWSA